jgi:hypothetical protein
MNSSDFVKDGWQAGLWKIIPSGATNGTVASNGTVTANSGITSLQIANCFNSKYVNYRIVIGDGSSSGNTDVFLNFTGSTTQYYGAYVAGSFATNTITNFNDDNDSKFERLIFAHTTNGVTGSFDVLQPALAKHTMVHGVVSHQTTAGAYAGVHKVATAYTGITITTGSGTFGGFKVAIYGYNI